jgi:RNA polymerase sigma-70 factor (sigma-E family)
MNDSDEFRAFAASRWAALVRSAWLLTGNQDSAQDLAQTALVKTWTRWSTVVRRDAPEAYVRRVMVSTYLTWSRRLWRGEHPTAEPPETADVGDSADGVHLRLALSGALQALPRRQRTVIVLRYFEDLTEQSTAELMSCSIGTVKSQSAKALNTLRADPTLRDWLYEEVIDDSH